MSYGSLNLKPHSHLAPRVQRLEEIGFQWEINVTLFEKRYRFRVTRPPFSNTISDHSDGLVCYAVGFGEAKPSTACSTLGSVIILDILILHKFESRDNWLRVI